MKLTRLLPWAFGASILTTGCQYMPWSADNTMNTQTQTMNQVQVHNAAKALGVLVVLNQNEINAAHIALNKSSNPLVRDYAQMLEKAHTQNLNNTMRLSRHLGITPEQGSVARTLENKGKQEANMLKHASGHAFDRAYINAMIQGHRKALTTIDNLIAHSDNQRVEAHLTDTRAHVASHLQQARHIWRQMR